MGMVLDGQDEPFKAMGFVKRATAWQEWGIGAALGWGLVVLAVLPMAVTGAMRTTFWTEPRAFWLFGINLGTLVVAAWLEEVTFRGYPFQRLIEAVGPTTATIIMSVFFGAVHIWNTDASLISVLVTMLAGVLLSLAYLRTRALWLPWGIHFAWNLSMGAVLGLPVSGYYGLSTIIQTQTVGAHWLTGGAYGPEAGLFTFLVLVDRHRGAGPGDARLRVGVHARADRGCRAMPWRLRLPRRMWRWRRRPRPRRSWCRSRRIHRRTRRCIRRSYCRSCRRGPLGPEADE